MKRFYLKIQKRELIVAVVAVLAGLGLGLLVSQKNSETDPNLPHFHSESEENFQQIWTCSMHPQIRQSEPGDCPICGMELIQVQDYSGDSVASSANDIPMTEDAMKLAEVQTITVKKGYPRKNIFLFGRVKPDERNISVITARFPGRIEKLFVSYTGQQVKKGQKLASVYSPQFIIARQELLDALKVKETNPSFYRAVRTKLKLWELTDRQIDELEKKRPAKHLF